MSENLEKFITQGQTVDLPKEKNQPLSSDRTEQSVLTAPTPPIESAKRSSTKQRKASMEEYQQTYLTTPKIVDRQTVFISRQISALSQKFKELWLQKSVSADHSQGQ